MCHVRFLRLAWAFSHLAVAAATVLASGPTRMFLMALFFGNLFGLPLLIPGLRISFLHRSPWKVFLTCLGVGILAISLFFTIVLSGPVSTERVVAIVLGGAGFGFGLSQAWVTPVTGRSESRN